MTQVPVDQKPSNQWINSRHQTAYHLVSIHNNVQMVLSRLSPLVLSELTFCLSLTFSARVTAPVARLRVCPRSSSSHCRQWRSPLDSAEDWRTCQKAWLNSEVSSGVSLKGDRKCAGFYSYFISLWSFIKLTHNFICCLTLFGRLITYIKLT